MEFTLITAIYAVLYGIRQAWETLLNRLNIRWIRQHSHEVPDVLAEHMDSDRFQKCIAYDEDTADFNLIRRFFGTIVHWVFILVGFACLDAWIRSLDLSGLWSGILFLSAVGTIHLLLDLPFSLYEDFKLESRYGFNRKTPGLFFTDLLKTVLVSILLGLPLLTGMLLLMEHAGFWWWIWAFAGITLFQFFVHWIYPVWIAPLFNTFTPLQGELADSIDRLSRKVGFDIRGIYTMNGSKRSTHTNAYFTGLGRFKRIVFYDTLLHKMQPDQILAVLGHEMGHFKLGHVRRIMILSQSGLLVFLAFMAYLKHIPVLYPSFGFPEPSHYAALLIFSMIFSETTYPFQFLVTSLLRRHEFAADRFSVRETGDSAPLIRSLQALHENNLSNPIVHPWYAAYYFSHPGLKERIEAIRNVS
ncbi:M48 family metallopeptidase [bacterium]|nr:M48 family metallopeptidase [candidate division CSSED10-310 bacterium]